METSINNLRALSSRFAFTQPGFPPVVIAWDSRLFYCQNASSISADPEQATTVDSGATSLSKIPDRVNDRPTLALANKSALKQHLLLSWRIGHTT